MQSTDRRIEAFLMIAVAVATCIVVAMLYADSQKRQEAGEDKTQIINNIKASYTFKGEQK